MVEHFLTALNKRIDLLTARVETLEQFFPILQEHFAGRIGGTSNDSSAILEALGNADPEALREALVENASAAKSTEKPING